MSGPREGLSKPVADTRLPAAGPDVYEQLKKLGELRDAGILTDEEFAAKKQVLLDQM
jgi:hypothetical protein